MATFKSDLATGQTAKGDNRVDGRLLAGKVRQSNATVTLAGTEVADDVIELVTIPSDALLDLSQSFVVAESAGTTFTCKLGTPSSDALATGLDFSSAGVVQMGVNTLYTVPAGEEKIILTVTAASGVDAGKKLRVCLSFIDRN